MEGLSSLIPGAIRTLGKRTEQRFMEDQMPISLKQHYILVLLGMSEEVFQTVLADVLDRDKSAVLRQIDQLEALGLLARESDSTDRRKKRLVLTDMGREVRERGRLLVEETLTELTQGITPEDMEVFMKVLKQIRANGDIPPLQIINSNR